MAADCLQHHERGRRPPHAGGAGAVRASVPGKGGRRGTGGPGLGAGPHTRPARPFVRLSGAARHRAPLGTGRRRPGAGRAAGSLRGGASARPSAAGTGRWAASASGLLRGRLPPSGGCDGCQVSPLLGAHSNPGHGEPGAAPSPARTRVHVEGGGGRGTRAPGSPIFPAPKCPVGFRNKPVPSDWGARPPVRRWQGVGLNLLALG